jgi:hypothetical protein
LQKGLNVGASALGATSLKVGDVADTINSIEPFGSEALSVVLDAIDSVAAPILDSVETAIFPEILALARDAAAILDLGIPLVGDLILASKLATNVSINVHDVQQVLRSVSNAKACLTNYRTAKGIVYRLAPAQQEKIGNVKLDDAEPDSEIGPAAVLPAWTIDVPSSMMDVMTYVKNEIEGLNTRVDAVAEIIRESMRGFQKSKYLQSWRLQ